MHLLTAAAVSSVRCAYVWVANGTAASVSRWISQHPLLIIRKSAGSVRLNSQGVDESKAELTRLIMRI